MSPLGWVIAALLVVLLVLELVGVARKDKGDTITEVYRTIRAKLPRPLALVWVWLVAGLLAWTLVHFLFDFV